MIELQPLHVYFDTTRKEMAVNFTCLYKASDPLGEIAFFIDNRPMMTSSISRTKNRALAAFLSGNYQNSNYLSERLLLAKGTQYVHCRVYNLDNVVIGSMSSKVHYKNRGWLLSRGFKNTFYTVNGLPLSEFFL